MVRYLRRIRFLLTPLLSVPNICPKHNARFLLSIRTYSENVKRDKITQIITIDSQFNQKSKDKETFLALIESFKKQNFQTGIVEFIYCALKRMEEYGVHEDLEVYKKLIDLMPKGRMIPTNWFLADTLYYPKHQNCISILLLQMEENRVYPDRKLYDILKSIFGEKSGPMCKYYRMQYWMPKFKNLTPWPHPRQGVPDKIEAAKLALKRMGDVDFENEITVFHTKDDESCAEDTWIVSCQSPTQKNLIHYHPATTPMFVEGPFPLYMGRKDRVQYFVLKSNPPPNRRRRKFKDPDLVKNLKIPFFDPPTPEDMIPEFSVHEQRDGLIFGMCVTGTSSKQSLLSWIRSLQSSGNPRLAEMAILFRYNSPVGEDTTETNDEDDNGTKFFQTNVKNTA